MAEPKKNRFLKWLNVKYLISIRHEDDLASKGFFRLKKSDLMIITVLILCLIQGLSILLTYKVRQSWINPGYAEFQSRQQISNLSLSVDSLVVAVNERDQYIDAIKKLVVGKDIGNEVDTNSNRSVKYENVNMEYIDPVDSLLRQQFEGEQTDVGFSAAKLRSDLIGLHLFSPVSGIVSDKFDAKFKHFGIDVVAAENEPIKAALEGTVFIASWTDDSGYIIGIQHKNNLLSFYKHNATLLKKNGDFVMAGEVIAIIGNTGELSSGPHLHFELWLNGSPVNPEDYIRFD